MAITIKSKVKDIVESEEAVAILKKHMPDFELDNPALKQAYGMTLKALLSFPATKCPRDVQKAIAADLEEAGIE